MKTQITVSSIGRVLDVSSSYPGSVHDKKIIDQEKTIAKIPKKTPLRFDSGYQGVQKDYPFHYLILPFKKPKDKELLPHEKEFNQVNSKHRVKVEHAFAKFKNFKILRGLFRNKISSYNMIFRGIAALLNFRLAYSNTPI